MKISLMCNSLLLTKTLSLYLKEYIVDKRSADFIISDHMRGKGYLFVSSKKESDLQTPFTKEMLFDAIEYYIYQNRPKSKEEMEVEDIVKELQQKQLHKIDKIVGGS